jgi:hypothetical protein
MNFFNIPRSLEIPLAECKNLRSIIGFFLIGLESSLGQKLGMKRSSKLPRPVPKTKTHKAGPFSD